MSAPFFDLGGAVTVEVPSRNAVTLAYAAPTQVVELSPGLYRIIPEGAVRIAVGRASKMGRRHTLFLPESLVDYPVKIGAEGVSLVAEGFDVVHVYFVPVGTCECA